ncbi:MAG: SPASM domain-containing protein [Ruminococcus sp.]|nr:SPASM domain-containing protein [Ruminococcus sp.]
MIVYSWFKNALAGLESELNTLVMDFGVDEENGLIKIGGETIKGGIGKTVWYIPVYNKKISSVTGLQMGKGLKIVKLPVYNDFRDEYFRLIEEMNIQKIMFVNGLAKDIYDIVLVKNLAENQTQWLGEEYFHPQGSVYLATVVDNVVNDGWDDFYATIDSDGNIFGEQIADYINKCHKLKIEPYDFTHNNFFNVHGNIFVIDFHKWKRTCLIKEPMYPEYIEIEINVNIGDQQSIIPDELFYNILLEASQLGIKYIVPIMHGDTLRIENYSKSLKIIKKVAPKIKIVERIQDIYISQENIFDLSRCYDYELCDIAVRGMTVLSDGKCYPCRAYLDEDNNMGNIKDGGILAVWNSNEYKWFRYLHKKSKLLNKSCRRCRNCIPVREYL